MSTTMQPPAPAPKNVNRLGLTIADYKGGDSTLCAGCGHDAITARSSRRFTNMGVEPHRVAKLSGIGCSSKTPAYFLSKSHGFNGVHGRMPALATGVMLANRNLVSHRRQRRRRHGFDRHGPVRSPAAPQYSDDLHRREQRRVRTDQGTVLRNGRLRIESQERSHERSAGHRHLHHGDRTGLQLRLPLFAGDIPSRWSLC